MCEDQDLEKIRTYFEDLRQYLHEDTVYDLAVLLTDVATVENAIAMLKHAILTEIRKRDAETKEE